MALFVAYVWLVLWPNYGLVVNNLWTESGTVLCPVGGIIVWLWLVAWPSSSLFMACFEAIV